MQKNIANPLSEYNRDQWVSFMAIKSAMETMGERKRTALRNAVEPYLAFRSDLRRFHERFFAPHCATTCFTSARSACCGFESIFTFFADQVITYLVSDADGRERIFEALVRPYRPDRCVYLGPKGCVWTLPPISCAMFYCDEIKERVLQGRPNISGLWQRLRETERMFTYPDRPVLFDAIESVFLALGVSSPHMYFHTSPGLLRIKRKSGLWDSETADAYLDLDAKEGCADRRLMAANPPKSPS